MLKRQRDGMSRCFRTSSSERVHSNRQKLYLRSLRVMITFIAVIHRHQIEFRSHGHRAMTQQWFLQLSSCEPAEDMYRKILLGKADWCLNTGFQTGYHSRAFFVVVLRPGTARW